jgi:hypothetical protein
MGDYVLNEKDIESTIKYLKIFDPKNADRDYAIQLLAVMQITAKDIVKDGNGEVTQDLIEKARIELEKQRSKGNDVA